MAQHPFGPIENQLIVGYYKRGKGFSTIKPTFKLKRVLVQTELSHQVLSILQPVFYGWSPANGNSSSHDFTVGYSFERKFQHELLVHSRGLGYRITFTMPEKGLRGELEDQQLSCQIAILDIFGEKVLSQCSLSIPPSKFKSYLPKKDLMMNRSKLEIEVTPLHIKVIENSKNEYVMTTFESPNGPSVPRDYGMILTFDYLFDGQRDPTYWGGRYDEGFMEHFRSMAAYLAREHRLMDGATKARIREHMMYLVGSFVGGCRLMADGKTEKDPEYETYRRLKDLELEHKLERWFDGQGGYPLDLNSEFLALMYTDMRKNSQGSDRFSYFGATDESDNYFARGMPEPFSKNLLSLLEIGPVNYSLREIQNHDTLRDQILDFKDSNILPQKFALRNFTLERESEYSPFSFGLTKQPDSEKHLLFTKNKSDSEVATSRFEVILDTDLLLGSQENFDRGHCFYLVDIAATHEKRRKNQQVTVARQISGPRSTTFQEALVFGSHKGISVLGYSRKRDPSSVKLFYHSFAKRSSAWGSFVMDGFLTETNKQFYLGSVFETKNSDRVYASVLLPSDQNTDSEDKQFGSVKSAKYHFFCTTYSDREKTLKLMHHNSLICVGVKLDLGYGMKLDSGLCTVWQQSGSCVFAVIFSYSTKFGSPWTPPNLWIIVDWKGCFISLGSRSKSHISPYDLSKQFSSFIPLNGIHSFVGVLGVSRPERTADGHDLYRLGRLRLRL